MIRARAAYNLGELVQVVLNSRLDFKLVAFEGELLKALRKVRDTRFQLRQDSFKALRTNALGK